MAKSMNLQDLYKEWRNTINDTVVEVVPPIMKEKMEQAIFEVYLAYNPTEYIRRMEDGGLLDEDNLKHTIEIEDNKIIIKLVNDTMTNTDEPNNSGYQYLDKLIVEGDQYTWEESKIYKKQPFPRDFYARTTEMLEEYDIRNKIINELKSRGIIVK